MKQKISIIFFLTVFLLSNGLFVKTAHAEDFIVDTIPLYTDGNLQGQEPEGGLQPNSNIEITYVLLPVGEKPCSSAHELYAGILNVQESKWLGGGRVNESISYTFNTGNSGTRHKYQGIFYCFSLDLIAEQSDITVAEIYTTSGHKMWQSYVFDQTVVQSGGGTPPPGGGTEPPDDETKPPGGGTEPPPSCPAGQEGLPPDCKFKNPAPGQLAGDRNFADILQRVIQILLGFAGVIAVIFLILGGFQYIGSRGNEEAMEGAKRTITTSIIGIIIIIMSFAIVQIVNRLVTVGV